MIDGNLKANFKKDRTVKSTERQKAKRLIKTGKEENKEKI
jgi:hypothetical protein